MKSIMFFIVLLFCSMASIGQTKKLENQPKFAKFGLSIGGNYSNLSSGESLPDNAKFVNGVGINLGGWMEYPISKKLLFSPKAELSFNKAQVDFRRQDNSKYRLFQSSLDFMVHFVYKISDKTNIPYLLFGPKLQLPFSKEPVVSSNFDKNNNNLAIDFGLGVIKTSKKYILNPELRYSFGVINVNSHPLLGSLRYNSLSLVLKFKKIRSRVISNL